MLKYSPFFAGFSIDDRAKAKQFYADTLGVFRVVEENPPVLVLQGFNGHTVMLYEKPNHDPATYTVLNFPVEDIEATVDRLRAAGVEFEQYDEGPLKTDEKGIATPGPKQAWFKDPAGNILSVLQEI
jgi:catechol 2,3-dioxygenase-like lactoylglutathione lyase family enzyme